MYLQMGDMYMDRKVIEIRELSYTYPDGKNALDNVSLDVYEGETLGLVGANGAGKTTLLLHLNGILQGKGIVRIAGVEVCERNLKLVRSKVGMIFQNPDDQLFMPTVFEDVGFGPLNKGVSKKDTETLVDGALRAVSMQGKESCIPHHLSFGEKKRICVATVLSMSPEILVLDEPTSNLDPVSRREFIRLFSSLSKTRIVASHDLEMVLEIGIRVVVLSEGKIVADGPVAEILGNQELMEANGLEVPLSLRLVHSA
jgi:cobalt/nickel transport system ATP-binding protein